MTPEIENAKRIIGERVELFARQRDLYRAPEYKEAQLRKEFLDPFFEALGWDVANRQGWAEQSKQVVNEDALKITGTTKAPDYSFRIGGARKFFVEAKKPQVGVKTDGAAAYQLRRYAWSAQLPLSILTDFEELAVYDCRARPAAQDKPSVGRINFITFDQYLDRLPEIYDVFSMPAVLRGSFDRYVQTSKVKRGTSPVDAEFLKEIEAWRATLAKTIAALNPRLALDELNDAVQRTIDRIIFLRMAEDRGAEEYGRLLRATAPLASVSDQDLRALTPNHILQLGTLAGDDATRKGGVYARLLALCRDAEAKYDSGLFDFASDQLTPALKIDDDKLRGIIAGLYFPQSPYEFSVLGADTLGNVYEQFLGKVIRLTPARQVKIEEKPAVKKAGGVYYTPPYIVDYIVQQTVGKLIADQSPDEIAGLAGARKGAPLRIVDPACGSGSFLLGAYQRLLDHCLAWYVAHRQDRRVRDRIYESTTGWHLTTAEKKRLLTTHIFGVDIDRQAVEVTKLSLLLKVLEHETRETLGKQLQLFKERALPNLDANIKCGNSLIGTDYFAGQLLPDPDELRRVNPFDWAREFPDALRAGGFDCVIGNPPYVRIQTLKEWAPLEVELYKEKYAAARAGNYDIYVVFVEKGLRLLNANGRLGFILPHKFFNAKYGEPLRNLIGRGKHLAHVVHFDDQQVFPGATTYTCLMFLDQAGSPACEFARVHDLSAWRAERSATTGAIPAEKVTRAEWHFTVGASAALFDKLAAMPVKLGDVAKTFVGTQTSADDVFVLDECKIVGDHIVGKSETLKKQVKVEVDCTVPFLRGKEIRRFAQLKPTSYLICPYEISAENSRLYTLQEMHRKFPLATKYLEANKAKLVAREKGRFKGESWYAFGYPKSMTLFQKTKIVVPDYNNIASFTFDSGGHFFKTGYGILANDETLSPLYLLGLLNSSLLFRHLRSISTELRGGYVRFWTQFIEQLPIRTINFDDATDAFRHRRLVTFVEQMLELHQRRAAALTAADREMYQRQIAATDEQIDAIVYALYGLTEEEIKIVESA